MTLDVREYSGTDGRVQIAMWPPIGGATGLTAAGTYTVLGPSVTILEITANGAAHTYTISGSSFVMSLASGSTIYYGVRKDAVLTVVS